MGDGDTDSGVDAVSADANVSSTIYEMCVGNYATFSPPSGATVTLTEPYSETPRLICDPHCGIEGETEIVAVEYIDSEISLFCLANVSIPANVTVVHDGSLEKATVWLVDSDVQIEGTIDFSGQDAAFSQAGKGGPGGGDGAGRSSREGNDGDGACAGKGGAREGSGDHAAGGGGGGGFGGKGGKGGQGNDADGDDVADGGNGGDMCGMPELMSLVGGSGGGGGANADASGCSGGCGGAGGGGGGALRISARTSITLTGAIVASGGDGYEGELSRGAGGGGSGGMILLESPMILLDGGTISVDGGKGGKSAAGEGGEGATMAEINGTEGANETKDGQGGAGGGGGGGRIRLNSLGAATACTSVSPEAACTSGDLDIMP